MVFRLPRALFRTGVSWRENRRADFGESLGKLIIYIEKFRTE